MKTFTDLEELEGSIGTHLGYSPWHTVSQDQIDAFAEATGDRQWIHTDPERAAAGPFRTTIAHGYLALSLLPMLVWQVFTVEGFSINVNYGADKLRFISPLPVDSRVRAGVELLSASWSDKGTLLRSRITLELEGGTRPVCVVDSISLLVP
ncbi:dehydratase [Microbacterium mangrovi]|uniref:Dehydratase n=1 Tax=Microbacterium mangrovi TaxID=1348253 RepID=A0A0B2A6W2_9MICO|nr:MaoC family dehydratase [Microbacterium mangrovi]KHK98810.1 dehydratase [Microbacterium mangrovi]